MPATSAPTIEEAIAAVNAAVGDDKAKVRELAKKLRADVPDVANYLITSGKNQKDTEIQPRIKELETKVTELTEQLEAKDQDLEKLRANAPDAAQIEDAAKKKWEPKVTKEKERADAAEARARKLLKDDAKARVISRVKKANDQGLRVDDGWADKVVAAEIDDRIVVKDDGTIDVLQLGESTAYDGDTLDAKLDALARDARHNVPPAYQVSNADAGAGIRSGGNGGVGLKSIEQIKQQKLSSPSFAGI